jgi:signal transduction histidine kinase
MPVGAAIVLADTDRLMYTNTAWRALLTADEGDLLCDVAMTTEDRVTLQHTYQAACRARQPVTVVVTVKCRPIQSVLVQMSRVCMTPLSAESVVGLDIDGWMVTIVPHGDYTAAALHVTAQASNDIMPQLLSNASHELRTPCKLL